MGAPFGPKSHVWLVARVPDARLIPERDRSVLAFYFYVSVEIIISRGTLRCGKLVKAGGAVEGTNFDAALPPAAAKIARTARLGLG